MSKDAQTTRKDSRIPVWQGLVNGKLVTIYDWAAYEEAKRLYPDDLSVNRSQMTRTVKSSTNTVKPFAKQKPQARYNWITKLDAPLKGRTV